MREERERRENFYLLSTIYGDQVVGFGGPRTKVGVLGEGYA